MNKRVEDYLKTIYSLTVEKEKKLVQVSVLAVSLEVTIQTANEMIKKLDSQNFVNYKPYKGVELTKKGLNEAVRIVRAHRVLEVFLTETLKFNWSEVHEDAEKLEHAASEKVINALYDFLGRPLTDPHGHPIPKLGKDNKMSMLSLIKLKKGNHFKIIRINESQELFKYLDLNNIKINDSFTVLENNKEEEHLVIKNKKEYKIKYNIAKKIFIELK